MSGSPYRVVVKESVLKDLRRLPRMIIDRLYARIAHLAEEPFPEGVEKIQGYEHHYRIRIGAYRVVYEVGTEIRIITVIRIGHRKDVYRKL